MNREDIIRMARDCGINFHQAGWPELERFARMVAAAEREMCAEIVSACCEYCADTIRSGGNA